MRALLLVVTALAFSACDWPRAGGLDRELDASSLGDGISSRGAARPVEPPSNLTPRAAGGGPQLPDECEVVPEEQTVDGGALLPKHGVVPRKNHEDNI